MTLVPVLESNLEINGEWLSEEEPWISAKLSIHPSFHQMHRLLHAYVRAAMLPVGSGHNTLKVNR
jgi:hypothetical protein